MAFGLLWQWLNTKIHALNSYIRHSLPITHKPKWQTIKSQMLSSQIPVCLRLKTNLRTKRSNALSNLWLLLVLCHIDRLLTWQNNHMFHIIEMFNIPLWVQVLCTFSPEAPSQKVQHIRPSSGSAPKTSQTKKRTPLLAEKPTQCHPTPRPQGNNQMKTIQHHLVTRHCWTFWQKSLPPTARAGRADWQPNYGGTSTQKLSSRHKSSW